MATTRLPGCRLGSVFRAWIALSLLTGVRLAHGLDAERELTQYRLKTWGQEEGLPQNSVRALAQTPDGYLWLGTEEGLVRFDGAHFEVFNRANTATLPSNRVADLQVDNRGRLWLVTLEGELLCRQADGRFVRPKPAGSAPADAPNALCLGRGDGGDDVLWAGARAGGPRQIREGEMRAWPGPAALASRVARAVAADGAGGVWLGTEAGLYHLPPPPGAARLYAEADGLPNGQVQALLRTGAGEVWAGTRAGVARLDPGTDRFTPIAADALGGQAVNTLGEDHDGNLWAGTLKGGLWRRRAGTGDWQALRARDGLPDDRVVKVFEDREGNLWVATAGGLARLTDVNLASYSRAEGLPDDQTRVVLAGGREGSVWVGTPNGLGHRAPDARRFQPEVIASGRPGKEGLGNFVISLYEDAAGTLYFGTADYVLHRRVAPAAPSALAASLFGAPEEIALAGGPSALCERRPGELWVGTSAGLYRFEDGRQTAFYTTREGLAGNAVLALCAGGEGDLWIGTRGGLSRWRDGRVENVPAPDGHPLAVPVSALHLDAAGTLWVGTIEQGLRRRLPGQPLSSACTSQQGLFHDTAYTILEEADRLWMSCNRGVYSVAKVELQAFFEGRRTTVACAVYGTTDGMRSAECNGGFSPAGGREAGGRLWFPTTRGVVSVDPARLRRNALPPPVWVEHLSVDGRPASLEPAPVLGPGVRGLELGYTALSLTATEKVRFRYQLEGYDPGWVEAGAQRRAFYTNLPPGQYRFRVSACNNDGVWNEAGVSVAFSLRPYFHQTGWFAGLVVLGVLAGGAGLFWLRQRQLQQRFAGVLAERTRIARELHDTCAQALFAIGFELESAHEALPVGPLELDPVRNHLESARSVMRQGLADARALIATLRGRTPERQAAADDVREALAKFIATANTAALDFTLNVDANAAALLPEKTRHELLRICQEAIHNAIKHADASSVIVEVGFDSARPGWVFALVADDGRGFVLPTEGSSAARPESGFGLCGMQERAAHAGGRLEVTSAPGQGTQVRLDVPFDAHARPHEHGSPG